MLKHCYICGDISRPVWDDYYGNLFCGLCSEKIHAYIKPVYAFSPFSMLSPTRGNCYRCRRWVIVGSKGIIERFTDREIGIVCETCIPFTPNNLCTSCQPWARPHRRYDVYCAIIREMRNVTA